MKKIVNGEVKEVTRIVEFEGKKRYCYSTEEKDNFVAMLDRLEKEYVVSVPAESDVNVALEIALLKNQLTDTDYKIVKCSEYQLKGLELPYDIIALHDERQELRDKINVLEAQL